MILYKSIPRVQLVSAVLWPSFLLAGAATAVFFTFLDPVSLFDFEGEAPLSRMAAYSLGFFLFWLLGAASSAATAYFMRPTDGAVSKDDGSV
ncbi:MAG TPA: hypothetical protein VLS27_19625 [Gammaproteobacteria bacterium]|nr:hypothetical protein [Gammaproteobacteria bacterium]